MEKNTLYNINDISFGDTGTDRKYDPEIITEPKNDDLEGPNTPGTWNYTVKLLLKKIGEKSMGFKWMHNQDRIRYERIYMILKRVEVILLALIVILTSSGFVYFLSVIGLEGNNIIVIIISAVQLLILSGASIVKTMREIGGYDKLIFDHKYSSSRFNQISLQIQTQLALDLKDRMNDVFFIKHIVDTYNKLVEISPIISSSTMTEYIDAVKDKDIHKPLLLGKIDDQLEIVIDGPENHDQAKNTENDQLYDNNKYQMDRWLQNF